MTKQYEKSTQKNANLSKKQSDRITVLISLVKGIFIVKNNVVNEHTESGLQVIHCRRT